MGKYLIRGSFTQDGLKGILKEGGTGRRKAVATLVESVGGSLESYYFAFGDDSYFIVIDMPDDETAASVALTVAASGAVVISTIKLLTPEQIDVAVKRTPTYRAPGH
jgi:uncharacterized protein with GYD domain